MDDLDSLILKTLQRLNCSFCAEVDSLSLMGVEDIVEAVVRLVWACDPTTKSVLTGVRLPASMTLRYKTATSIADAIKKIGIREELGYHTLLYPNITDIRNVLISLIEKLPKDNVVEDVSLSPLKSLQRTIGEQIRIDMENEWTPGYCRLLRLNRQGLFWYQNPEQPFSLSFANKVSDQRSPVCQMMDLSTRCHFDMNYLSVKKSTPPKLLPKPVLSSRKECGDESVQQHCAVERQQEEKLRTLSNLFSVKTQQKSEAESRREVLLDKVNWAKAERSKRNVKLIQLFDDGPMEKATRFLAEESERRSEMERSFFEWRSTKMDLLHDLHKRNGLSDGYDNDVEADNKRLQNMLKTKKQILHRLNQQCELPTASDSDDRNKLLDRIWYLAENVAAQKLEVAKSLSLCAELNREKQSLLGSLDRIFTVVTSWLGDAAETDIKLKNAHDLVIKLHSKCADVGHAINQIHSLNKETDELQDDIDMMAQHKVGDQLSNLLNDLNVVHQEIRELAKL